jgi:hypothetical protein
MKRFLSATLLLVLSVAVRPAQAEKVHETRDRANYVVTGTVQAVYTRDANGYLNHLVEIKIEEIDKGTGLKRGDALQVSCFQRKPAAGTPLPGASGHKAPPQEGQRIKAFVIARGGVNAGVYPNWFDLLPEIKK